MHSSSEGAELGDPIPSYKTGLLNSFRCAFRGIWLGVRTQRNVRIHLAMGVGAVALGAALKITALEWALLSMTISLVISMELVNTAVEYLVDLVSPQYHPLAGAAKDVAAGGALVSALGAVGVGVAVFAPRLWAIVKTFLAF